MRCTRDRITTRHAHKVRTGTRGGGASRAPLVIPSLKRSQRLLRVLPKRALERFRERKKQRPHQGVVGRIIACAVA